MGFRDEYLSTGKTYGEWSLEQTIEGRLEALQKTTKKTFESGIERFAKTHVIASAALQAELVYQAEIIGQTIQQGTSETVTAVEQASSDIVFAIQQLSDYLGAGFGEIRWAVERHTQVTQDILRVLLSSLDSESRQFYEQGVKCFETREYDLAKERFSRALDANRTNYFAYQYLGRIAVEQDSSAEATRSFELARKFAETAYHRALALSHLARAYHATGDAAKATELSRLAVEEHPETPKYWYDFAVYSARNQQEGQAITALRKAIELDLNYYGLSSLDEDLDCIRIAVTKLTEELRDNERVVARRCLDELENVFQRITSTGVVLELLDCTQERNRLEEAYTPNNIFLYREIQQAAPRCRGNALNTARDAITANISACESDQKREIALLDEKVTNCKKEKEAVSARYSPLEAGFVGHFGIWIFLIVCIVGVMSDVSKHANPPSKYDFVFQLIIILSFIVPKLMTVLFNRLSYSFRVSLPHARIDRMIIILEQNNKVEKKKIEEKYLTLKAKLLESLRGTESLLCGSVPSPEQTSGSAAPTTDENGWVKRTCPHPHCGKEIVFHPSKNIRQCPFCEGELPPLTKG